MTCDPEPPRFVIRRLALPHCARGPARCARCREDRAPALCLLDTQPDPPEAARPVIALTAGGRTVHRAYDVVQVFDDVAAARACALERGIVDVEL